MKILLVNHYAGSLRHGMEYRPFYLAQKWVCLGHEVIIVAASVSHIRTSAPIIHGGLTQETIDGVVYNWLKTPNYQGNSVRRVLNILAFVAQLYRFANYWAKKYKPDIVITSSTHPLDNFPCKWIASQAGAKLIYEVHDLWPLSLIELGGMSPLHPFIRLIQWGENYAYINADYVVSLLPNALEHMQAHGLSPEKFIYIPNGFSMDEWECQNNSLPEQHQQAIIAAKYDHKCLVGYAGAHGLANALDTLLDAAQQLKDESVCFVLVGQGPEKTRLELRCAQEGLSNVLFLPQITKSAIPSFLTAMDVLYIGLKSQPLFRFGVSPNKLIDYMMAGKPIIYAISSGNTPVADAKCGFSIPPEKPEALAQAVKQCLSTSQADLSAMGKRGHEYCRQEHDFQNLAAQFLNSVS